MEAAAAGQDAGSKGATIHPVFRGLGAVTCSACKAHLLKAYVQVHACKGGKGIPVEVTRAQGGQQKRGACMHAGVDLA
jgi:hypothetical protein